MACLNINGRNYTLTEDELASVRNALTSFITTGRTHIDLSQTRYEIDIWISNGTVITTSRN